MIETKEKAIERVIGIWSSSKSPIAVYCANDKICISKEGSTLHETRLKVHAENLIGVYDFDCQLRMIIEDIDYFYAHLPVVPQALPEIPVFRSSGRRNK